MEATYKLINLDSLDSQALIAADILANGEPEYDIYYADLIDNDKIKIEITPEASGVSFSIDVYFKEGMDHLFDDEEAEHEDTLMYYQESVKEYVYDYLSQCVKKALGENPVCKFNLINTTVEMKLGFGGCFTSIENGDDTESYFSINVVFLDNSFDRFYVMDYSLGEDFTKLIIDDVSFDIAEQLNKYYPVIQTHIIEHYQKAQHKVKRMELKSRICNKKFKHKGLQAYLKNFTETV